MAAACFAPRFADVKQPIPTIFTSFTQEDPSLSFLARQFSAQSLVSDTSRPTSSGSDSSTVDSPFASADTLFRSINFAGSSTQTYRDTRDSFSPLDTTTTASFEPCRSPSISPAASSTSLCTLSSDKSSIRHPARSPRSRHSSLPSYRPQRRNALHADSSPRMLAMLLAGAAQQDGVEIDTMAIDDADDEDVAACRSSCVCKRERQGQKALKRKVVGAGSGPRRAV